ncbi:hypothetical protein C8F04DRAFT_1270535 [Mycena alexandri]|uniref:Uncharacterized protein n=1 Tax=Mycena alexandri TaxID=1745969 RepID=A0AAD6SB12_9AGAR|nr:hypothetical protein C8F04DRAFT_1270535 [Mycena alexandri]
MRDTMREFSPPPLTTSTDHRMLDKPVRDGYVFTWCSPHAIQTGCAPLAIPFHPSSNFVDASTHNKHNSRKWHWTEYNGSPAVFTKTSGPRSFYGSLLGVLEKVTKHEFGRLEELCHHAQTWALNNPRSAQRVALLVDCSDEVHAEVAVDMAKPTSEDLLTWSGGAKTEGVRAKRSRKKNVDAPPPYAVDRDAVATPNILGAMAPPSSPPATSSAAVEKRGHRNHPFKPVKSAPCRSVCGSACSHSEVLHSELDNQAHSSSDPGGDVGGDVEGEFGGIVVSSNGQLCRLVSQIEAAIALDPTADMQIVDDITAAIKWYLSRRARRSPATGKL